MNHERSLPADIEQKIASLGEVLASCSGLTFAYLFGGAAKGRLTPMSDVDVAAFFDEQSDLDETRSTSSS